MAKRHRRKKNNITEMITAMAAVAVVLVMTLDKDELKRYGIYAGIFLAIILISLLLIKKMKRDRYLKSPLSVIDNMSGEEFEQYLKYLFESDRYKYHVKMTPYSNDYGADLILTGNGEKIAVQAKRYRNKVSNKAVQEIAAATSYYGCNRGMVITNSRFTRNAEELARSCNIELWDRTRLRKEIKYISGKSDI